MKRTETGNSLSNRNECGSGAPVASGAILEAALERLRNAAIVVTEILDGGERDPTWHESQELEEAAIAYGRAVRKAAK